jgi:small subunit ribosomal protein S3Ae
MAKEMSSWKQKKEYKILAPENFDSKEVGVTFAGNEESLIGRSVDVSMKELVEDRSKQHLKLVLEITGAKDGKAHTKFKIFRVDAGYLHSKIRRGCSKIDYTTFLNLTDGKVRVKVIAVTQGKAKMSQKKEILSRIAKALVGYQTMTLSDFVQATLFGKLGTDLYHNTKTVSPINRVEIEEVRIA